MSPPRVDRFIAVHPHLHASDAKHAMRSALAGKRIVDGQIPHIGSAILNFELDVYGPARVPAPVVAVADAGCPELFRENPYRLRSRPVKENAMRDAVAALLEAYFLLALTRRWLSTLARSARATSAMQYVIAVHANSFTTFANGKGCRRGHEATAIAPPKEQGADTPAHAMPIDRAISSPADTNLVAHSAGCSERPRNRLSTPNYCSNSS
jgi:hypothetical protein